MALASSTMSSGRGMLPAAVPTGRDRQRLGQAVDQILDATDPEVQPGLAVPDLLRHAADAGADHRPPVRKASWITTGEFSHQFDGTITQSMLRISRGRSDGR